MHRLPPTSQFVSHCQAWWTIQKIPKLKPVSDPGVSVHVNLMVWRVSCRDITYIKNCFILIQWLKKKSTAFILLVKYAFSDNEPWSCKTPALYKPSHPGEVDRPKLSGGNQHPPSRAISWDSSPVARRIEPQNPKGLGGWGGWGPITPRRGSCFKPSCPHNFLASKSWWVLSWKNLKLWCMETQIDEQKESYGVMGPGLLEDTLSWRCDCKWMCFFDKCFGLTFLLFPTTNIYSMYILFVRVLW